VEVAVVAAKWQQCNKLEAFGISRHEAAEEVEVLMRIRMRKPWWRTGGGGQGGEGGAG
jgi:hypothetical protein